MDSHHSHYIETGEIPTVGAVRSHRHPKTINRANLLREFGRKLLGALMILSPLVLVSFVIVSVYGFVYLSVWLGFSTLLFMGAYFGMRLLLE